MNVQARHPVDLYRLHKNLRTHKCVHCYIQAVSAGDAAGNDRGRVPIQDGTVMFFRESSSKGALLPLFVEMKGSSDQKQGLPVLLHPDQVPTLSQEAELVWDIHLR